MSECHRMAADMPQGMTQPAGQRSFKDEIHTSLNEARREGEPRSEGEQKVMRRWAQPSMFQPSRYSFFMKALASGVSGLVPVLPSY